MSIANDVPGLTAEQWAELHENIAAMRSLPAELAQIFTGGPPIGLRRDKPVSLALAVRPDGDLGPIIVDPWGRVQTVGAAMPRKGPTITIPGGQQNSGPIWVQGVDENPVSSAGEVLDPQMILRAFNCFDAVGRLAGDLISIQATPDRENWFTVTQIFAATLGISVAINTATVLGSRGIRLRATAGPVGAAGLIFPTALCT